MGIAGEHPTRVPEQHRTPAPALKETQTTSIGYRLFPQVEVFQETFEKSAAKSLRQFFANCPSRKWMAFSDYAFYDKRKQADVFVLSLFPYSAEFAELSAQVGSLSFKDVKHLRRVNPEFIAYLRRAPIVNIAVLLGKDRRLHRDEREELVSFFSSLSAMVEAWGETTPEGSSYYKKCLKDLKHLRGLVFQRKANLRLIRDSLLVASVAGYLLFRTAQMTDAEVIGWFSDRDALLSYQSKELNQPLIFQLLHTYFHVLCEQVGMPSRENPLLGVPEEVGPVFYDSFLRVPDLVAATMADLHIESMSFSHPKFNPVLEDLLASNEKNLFFAVRTGEQNSVEAVRLTLERA